MNERWSLSKGSQYNSIELEVSMYVCKWTCTKPFFNLLGLLLWWKKIAMWLNIHVRILTRAWFQKTKTGKRWMSLSQLQIQMMLMGHQDQRLDLWFEGLHRSGHWWISFQYSWRDPIWHHVNMVIQSEDSNKGSISQTKTEKMLVSWFFK